MINLRSDNEVGAHPLIIEAVGRAFTSGTAFSYGADEWTQRVERRLRDIFERPELVAFPVSTGSAANVLALSCCTPPWGTIFCHPAAHIAVDEANAPQFFTGGAHLTLIDGANGKIDVKKLAEALAPGARVAVLSSRMGSIGLRAAPNSWLYRASKAAVNSVLKDASLALAGRAVCVAFHPGWVRTDMGGAHADIDVTESVAGIRRVLAGLTEADNGGFFNFDGQALAW